MTPIVKTNAVLDSLFAHIGGMSADDYAASEIEAERSNLRAAENQMRKAHFMYVEMLLDNPIAIGVGEAGEWTESVYSQSERADASIGWSEDATHYRNALTRAVRETADYPRYTAAGIQQIRVRYTDANGARQIEWLSPDEAKTWSAK